jgi:Rieske Fe-S protein
MLMRHFETPHDDAVSGCDDCALVGRRDFLRDAALAVAGVFAALGAAPSRAAAAPLEFVSALGGGRDEKRYPIPAADAVQIDKENGVILARWQGKVYLFSLACPHQNTALHWSDEDKQFVCPKHHSRFGGDGSYVDHSGRATRDMDRFDIRRDGNDVVGNLDKMYAEHEDAGWSTAFVAL